MTTLADAIALADGVHVARFNNGTWSVTARGFAAVAANKMLVMIDGRTVYSPVDLADIVDAAVEVMRPAAAAKDIVLTTGIEVRPAMTAGDPDRLQQIVWNLVSNAVKFTPAAPPTCA